MTDIAQAIDRIRAAHKQLGSAELSRRSGVPYTTIRDWEAKGFTGPSVETLEKLAAAASALGDQSDAA